MPTRNCDACGQEYTYQRKTSKFCCDNCRQRWFAAGSRRTRIPDDVRFSILRRDGFACRTCGLSPEEYAELDVDHRVPVSKGGYLLDPSNLITLCGRCNNGKGTTVLDPDEWPLSREPEDDDE
jgi:5-methylcytosine-specific restriction endonuclease McrA